MYLMVALFSLITSTIASECGLTENFTSNIKIDKTKTEYFNITKNSSLRWTYKTQFGYNLTVKITFTHPDPGKFSCSKL